MSILETRDTLLPAAGRDSHAAAAASAALPGWMVWLCLPDGREIEAARLRLRPDRVSRAVGRCLFVLPEDEVSYSWSRHGRRAALLYGHLLNREELLRRLEHVDHPSPSDADLVLLAYERWGDDMAGELDGTFAAVIWDEARETLLCIRDAIGAMPLFYSRPGGDLLLSSDVWTLLRHPDVSREVDRRVVAEHLLWRHSHVEDTFFTHVRRLPGGCRLRAAGAGVAIERYWNPAPADRPITWLDRGDLDRFPTLMEQTLAPMLAVGPTGVSLSAGIDSVSVAAFAVAAARAGSRPHAFSLYPGEGVDPALDESAGQKAVAGALEMPFRLLSLAEALEGRPLLETAMALSPGYPAPLGNMWEQTNICLMEAARERGMRVLLTGSGGDEWLCVSPYLAADLIRAADLAGLWRFYRSQVQSFHLSPLAFGRSLLWRFGMRIVLRDLLCLHLPRVAARLRPPVAIPGWVAPDPDLRRRLREHLQPPAPRRPDGSVYHRELASLMEHWVVPWELEEFYYRSRGRGVTYFHPYWSRPMVEFLLRIPPLLLNDGGRAKGFVRRLLAERFPQLGFERQRKLVHHSFYAQTIAAQWSTVWQGYAPDSALVRAGVVDQAGFERAMQDAVTAVGVRIGHVAQWLSTEAWLRTHL